VSLPGRATLRLPEGDVALYYEERVTLGENEVLNVGDYQVTARSDGPGSHAPAVTFGESLGSLGRYFKRGVIAFAAGVALALLMLLVGRRRDDEPSPPAAPPPTTTGSPPSGPTSIRL
jgi:hypothetical protein